MTTDNQRFRDYKSCLIDSLQAIMSCIEDATDYNDLHNYVDELALDADHALSVIETILGYRN